MHELDERFCEGIAKAYVGEPVRVEVAWLPHNWWGESDWAAGRVIKLAPRLLLDSHLHRLPGVFFHELGHHARGHVPAYDRAEKLDSVQAIESQRGIYLPGVREIAKRQEREAWDWARAELAEFTQRHGDVLQYMVVWEPEPAGVWYRSANGANFYKV